MQMNSSIERKIAITEASEKAYMRAVISIAERRETVSSYISPAGKGSFQPGRHFGEPMLARKQTEGEKGI